MELYATPPQDILPDPWLEHLCLHELRHVVQIDKLNQGITKILAVLFGQQATGLAAGQLPLWYYEGDAVCTETALGKFGRGRSPSFEKNIRTHLLSDEKTFTLDQSLFGSYKSNVPNHYEFGYQLTAYLRAKYGKNSWSLVENYVARNSYTLVPTPLVFSLGLKKYTGLNQKKLLKETLNYLDSVFTEEEVNYNSIQAPYFQLYGIKGFEDYSNPVFIDEKLVIALKRGLGHLPQFILVEHEQETVVFEPGVLVSDDFSYAKNNVFWAEYKPHYRWQNKEYTSIKMLNLETKKEKTIVSKSRYFSPAASSDANKIAVVEVSEKNEYFLTILSSFKGDIIARIPSENFIQRPKWSDDHKYIYVIELTEKGKQISRYSFEKKGWEFVFKAGGSDIQRIEPKDTYVYFHSTLNGKDEVHLFDTVTEKTYQISKSAKGIVDFCIDDNGQNIIAAEHSSQGNRFVKIPVERGLWLENKEQYKPTGLFSEELADQESFKIENHSIPNNEYPVKSYSKIAHLFNFHSWVPFYFDYTQNSVNGFLSNPEQILSQVHPGVMLLSQNKLSTAESIISYAYKDGHHTVQSSFIYKGFLPVIKLSANYGDLHEYFAPANVSWKPVLNYDNFSYSLDIYLPLTFSTGKMYGGFIPRVKIDYDNAFYYNYQKDYYVEGNEFVTSELYFYWLKRKAKRDLQPKTGISIDYKLNNTPFESDLFGYISNVEGTLYLPGFFKNHGIKLNAGHQFQDPELYLYSSQFAFPHGIEKFRTYKLSKFYVDYVFPIAYPDWSLGSLLYINRIKGGLFYNYAQNKFKALNQNTNTVYWATYNLISVGFEVSADYHLLRMIFPLNTGVRMGYTNYPGKLFYELVFNIDISGF
jgi:hypothetical protein